MRNWITALLFLAATCIAGPGKPAKGQLRWAYPPKKAPMRVRLVAIAISLVRMAALYAFLVWVVLRRERASVL